LEIPVKFIGIGEAVDDLRPFDAEDFADALFQDKPESEETE
jgi:fused signal recognition particle receptor